MLHVFQCYRSTARQDARAGRCRFSTELIRNIQHNYSQKNYTSFVTLKKICPDGERSSQNPMVTHMRVEHMHACDWLKFDVVVQPFQTNCAVVVCGANPGRLALPPSPIPQDVKPGAPPPSPTPQSAAQPGHIIARTSSFCGRRIIRYTIRIIRNSLGAFRFLWIGL